MKDLEVLYTTNYNRLEKFLKDLNVDRNMPHTCTGRTQYHKDVNCSQIDL